MSDLGHTQHTGHRQVQDEDVVGIPTERSEQSRRVGKKKVQTHKGPQRTQDTQSSSSSDPALQSQALYFLGLPILAMPKGRGLTSADMYAMVNNALDRHRKTQLATSVRLNPADLPEVMEHKVTVTTTKTEKNKEGQDVTTTTTTTSTTLVLQNSVLGAIANDLAREIVAEVKKKHKQPLTFNMVLAFVQQVLSSGVIFSALPALNFLESSTKPPTFSVDENHVKIASATAFAKIISQSGPEFEKFAKVLFPHNQKLAADLVSSAKSAFAGLALDKLSQALGLPGLSQQVEGQASVVRAESDIVHSSDFRRNVAPGLVIIVGKRVPHLDKKEAQQRINFALEDVAKKGQFNTRQELIVAFRDAFLKVFPGQIQLVDELTAKASGDALDSALAATGKVYLPQFDVNKLNVNSIYDSIKNGILKEFAESDREIRLETKADSVADAIRRSIREGKYRSESHLRADIQRQIIAQGFSSEKADKIASQVDLGLPIAPPLAFNNNAAILRPGDYRNEIDRSLVAIGISPNSLLGRSIHDLVGSSDNPRSTDMIGLINADYRASQTRGENYLNLNPSRQGIEQQQDFLDPGRRLVIERGSVMNGTPDRENHKRTSNNTV